MYTVRNKSVVLPIFSNYKFKQNTSKFPCKFNAIVQFDVCQFDFAFYISIIALNIGNITLLITAYRSLLIFMDALHKFDSYSFGHIAKGIGTVLFF